MPKSYIKHLVECNCVLPQYMNRKPTVFHKFVVFSVLDDYNEVIPSYAQCPNCNAIHKVMEVFVSKTLPRETVAALPVKQEIKLSLPEDVSNILENYGCDITVWQEVQFILENQLWGKMVILKKDQDDGNVSGKALLIAGEKLFKIETFSQEEEND